jgi:hypothetical protein
LSRYFPQYRPVAPQAIPGWRRELHYQRGEQRLCCASRTIRRPASHFRRQYRALRDCRRIWRQPCFSTRLDGGGIWTVR